MKVHSFMIFIFLFVQSIFGLELTLREDLYTDTPVLGLEKLFYETLFISKNLTLKGDVTLDNPQVSRMLQEAGVKDFILNGKQIRIHYIKDYSSREDVKKILLKNFMTTLPDNAVVPDLDKKSVITGLDLKKDGEKNTVYLELIRFSENIGEMERVCFSYLDDKSKAENDLSSLYLLITSTTSGELIFLKNAQAIRTRVRILSRTPEGVYTVLNTSSGKIFTVKKTITESEIGTKL